MGGGEYSGACPGACPMRTWRVSSGACALSACDAKRTGDERRATATPRGVCRTRVLPKGLWESRSGLWPARIEHGPRPTGNRAHLDHEARDDAVEGAPVEEPLLGQRQHVLHMAWGDIVPKLKFHRTRRGRHRDLWVASSLGVCGRCGGHCSKSARLDDKLSARAARGCLRGELRRCMQGRGLHHMRRTSRREHRECKRRQERQHYRRGSRRSAPRGMRALN
jgi:hypothetical protein